MTTKTRDLVDSELDRALSQFGLDVEYVRALGTSLTARGYDGSLIPVIDYMGGYGALILGHNDPRIVEYAKTLLGQDIPVFAQISRRPDATELVAVLNRIIGRELQTDEPYHAVFASSGAEAVETAVKHAELDRGLRLADLAARLDASVEAARRAVDAGARVAPSALAALELSADASFEEVAARLTTCNAARLSGRPRLLALTGGFHGKLMGSVQLTHNQTFRESFTSLAAQPRFLPVNQPDALRPAFEAERTTVLEFHVTGDSVTAIEHDVPVFCGFLVEPVQGEGGVVPLTDEFVKELQGLGAEFDCPVIVDEIQTGVGRTGAFFAGTHLALRGDYITLAKSLGGGVAKVAMTLVRQSRYRPQFEFVHSSTFAKDGFSTAVALRVVELLEADDGAAYRTVRERGARLAEALRSVRADHPGVIADVRGLGLFLGVEFADLTGSGSAMVDEFQPAGLFGFLVCGFLLHEHGIRTMPTASAPNTLRLQPSVGLTDDEIVRLTAGLRHVCTMLEAADDRRLTAFLGTRRF